MPSLLELQEKLSQIQDRITKAGGNGVQIVAATKSQDPQVLKILADIGINNFGESYSKELLSKAQVLDPNTTNKIDWHFIGQLQSNKVKSLLPVKIKLFQSVDRKNLIDALARHFPGNEILLQLNTTTNPKRGGVTPNKIEDLLQLATQASLKPTGIMVIARQDEASSIKDFQLAKRLQTDLGLKILSAGMSQDFELAVAEGANMVRLGRVFYS